jgi:hypothetical protein
MPQVGFEHSIPLSKRPQTHAFDLVAMGISTYIYIYINNNSVINMRDMKMSFLLFFYWPAICYCKLLMETCDCVPHIQEINISFLQKTELLCFNVRLIAI